MARRRSPWLKLAANIHYDARVRKARAGAVWPWVLCRLKDGDGEASEDDLDPILAAGDLCVEVEVAERQLDGLRRVGLLVEAEGAWTTPNWHEYQNSSTARVRAHRERQRNSMDLGSPRNVSERVGTLGNVGEENRGEILTLVEPPADEDSKVRDRHAATAGRLYSYWADRMGVSEGGMRRKRSTTAGRRRVGKVRARLAEGYSEEQIQVAIRGCAASPWHMGDNPRGIRYDDLELICRDGEHLRKFAEIAFKRGVAS